MKLLSASKIQRLGAMIARAAIPSIVIGTSICHGQELVPPRNADTAKASHEFKRIPVVAISDLQSNGISVAHLRVITDEISSQLQNTGFYRVMERSQMDRILVEQNFQQSGACDGSQCAVEIGRLLGIDRMLLGSVGLLGTTYTLHLRLVDVATGEILRNASAHLEGRIDDVLTQLVPKAVAVIASSSNGSRAVSVTPVATSPVAAIAPATSAWKPAPSTGPRVVARFESVPSGARVVDNGVELCTTPCQKAVPIGNHALLWELDGWMSYHDTVVVRESNQKFTRILTEVGSTVVVEAKDAGTQEDIAAEVWLAGGKIGNTPWQGTVTSQGNAISVRLVGYRDFDTALQVVKGKSITLQVALKRRDTRTIDLPDHGEVRVGSLVYKAPFIRQEVADSAFNREGATWITPWGTRWLRKEEERLTTWPVGLQLETELGFESNKWRGGLSATFDLAVGFPLGKKLSIVVLGHSAAYSTEFRNEVGGGVAYTNEFMKILFTSMGGPTNGPSPGDDGDDGFQSEEKLGVQFPAFRKKLLIGLALNTYTREQTERVIFSEESSMYSRRPEEGNYDYSYGILGSTLSIEYPLPPFRFGTTLGLSYCIVEEMEGNADSWYSWDHIARVSAPLCTEGEILPSAKVSLIWSW